MVTKSTENYGQYLIDVRDYYQHKYPNHKKYIDGFIDYTDKCLNRFQRSFLTYQTMWYLYERRKNVLKNQHFWVAFIGRKGGEGKSTIGKHMLNYMDNTFDPNKRTVVSYMNFIKTIKHTKKELQIKYPSILIDEPENKIHILSIKGRKLRDILGKIRQENLFVGICANSLQDIPSFIYHRLSCIVYLDEKHRFWVWDQMKDKPHYTIIDDMKKEFKLVGHKIFKDRNILKRAIIKNMTFSKEIPFDETEYLDNKSKDLYKDIDEFIYDEKDEKAKPIPKEIMIREILKNKPNLTDGMLAEALGISREWANILKNRVIKCEQGRNNNTMGGKEKNELQRDSKEQRTY